MMDNKIVKKITIFLWIVFSFLSYAFATESRPRYQTNIRYNSPAWLSNDRIVCAKHLDHYKLFYGLLANISKGTAQIFKSETQIISMKIDGTDERIIKNIVMLIKDNAKATSSERYFIGQIQRIDYNPTKKLIAFSELVNRIYLMNLDGTNLRKIAEPAGGPYFSPDGKYLQYTSNYKVWLYDLDTGEHKVLIQDAKGGPWSPDGKKIVISKGENYRPVIYTYDWETKKEELADSRLSYINDWSPDGIIITSSRVLLNPRVSPDGTKIVGEPYSDPQKKRINYIGIADIEDKNLKVLRYEEDK
jgi:Tol biopolymer transport system component